MNEINTFIQQGCIKSIKSESKVMYNVSKITFQINSAPLHFQFIKESCFLQKNLKAARLFSS